MSDRTEETRQRLMEIQAKITEMKGHLDEALALARAVGVPLIALLAASGGKVICASSCNVMETVGMLDLAKARVTLEHSLPDEGEDPDPSRLVVPGRD